MTFKLNEVTRAATGREIRREREVAGETLRIGRGPENDVRLTDLAVALRHATVRRVGALRLSVASEEGLGVELNGRKVSSGFIELATGGDIRIASHLLRFLPTAADADALQVEIERVGESAVEEAERADIRRFSAGAVLPGKRISAYVLIALVLGIFLAWPLWIYNSREPVDAAQFAAANRKADGSGVAAPQQAGFSPDSMWSTGSLSSVHHGLEGQCSACHVKAFEPVQDAACLTCHKVAIEQAVHGVRAFAPDQPVPPAEQRRRLDLSQPKPGGFDGFQRTVANFFGKTAGRCVDCHTEHEGPQEPVTAETNCSSCHTGLQGRLREAGATGSRIGDAGGFGSSHPDFRPSVIINWEGEREQRGRVAMNDRTPERSNLKFPHDVHLNAGNAVARMTGQLQAQYGGRDQLVCADCHTPTPDGARYQPVDMEQDCAACHTLAFDVQDGLYRTLRHGAPQQVIADLREFYRGRAPSRPAELDPVARRRPGTVNDVRTAVQYARARVGASPAANARIASVFQKDGACFDCHEIERRGPLDFHVQPVGFPDRYLLHGWFDHRPHTNMVLGRQTFDGDQACLTCHGSQPNEAAPAQILANDARQLMLPGLESCRRCHVDEGSNARVAGQAVSSGCAMCHDYHMDSGVPSMILHRRVRGQRPRSTLPVAALSGSR